MGKFWCTFRGYFLALCLVPGYVRPCARLFSVLFTVIFSLVLVYFRPCSRLLSALLPVIFGLVTGYFRIFEAERPHLAVSYDLAAGITIS